MKQGQKDAVLHTNHASSDKKRSNAKSDSSSKKKSNATNTNSPSKSSAASPAQTSNQNLDGTDVNGRSNSLPLLGAINLFDAPEQQLSPTQWQHQQMAQSMFDDMNAVSRHPTYCP
jgi:activator of HSP90 ATPase